MAPLAHELLVGPQILAAVAPVRKIGHQADQRRAAVRHATAHPAQDARQGIEVSVAGEIFSDYAVQ